MGWGIIESRRLSPADIFWAITFKVFNQIESIFYHSKALNVRIIFFKRIDLIRQSYKKLYLDKYAQS